MTLENKTNDAEYHMQLARERQVGIYTGKKGFYIGTFIREHDKVLLEHHDDVRMVRVLLSYEEQLRFGRHAPRPVHFVIYELGFSESKELDLINIQQHDTIAGPFEDYQTALNVLPYVIKVRYLKE